MKNVLYCMQTIGDNTHRTGEAFWKELETELSALLSTDDALVTTLANAAAFCFERIARINWAGFYLFDGKKLILGPFCGKPACTNIQLTAGVCGAAARTMQTVVVADVHSFPGHIVCDPNSRSEIVVPIQKNDGSLLGVLDIDSPDLNRFTDTDVRGIENLAQVIAARAAAPSGIL